MRVSFFMEEFLVYILYSEKFEKKYIGFTTALINRFKSHNILATKGWTIKFRPWKVVHVEFYTSKKEAMRREKFLKSGQGRNWIKKNVSII